MIKKNIITIEVTPESSLIISKMIGVETTGELSIHEAITLLDRMCMVMGSMLLYSPDNLLPNDYYDYKNLAKEICTQL